MMRFIKETLSILHALGRDTLKCLLGFFVGLFFIGIMVFLTLIAFVFSAFTLLFSLIRLFKWKS